MTVRVILSPVTVAVATLFVVGCGGNLQAPSKTKTDDDAAQTGGDTSPADDGHHAGNDGQGVNDDGSQGTGDSAALDDTAAGNDSGGTRDDGGGAGDDGGTGPSCNFNYGFVYDQPSYPMPFPLPRWTWDELWQRPGELVVDDEADFGPDVVAHPEPAPHGYYRRWLSERKDSRDSIVMPAYSDSMPLFERGQDWRADETRCYETPTGVRTLTQPDAYDLYRAIAEKTTGLVLSTGPNVRSVLGIRGAYVGQFAFNGNWPNRFNDTIVLLWKDAAALKHVREFPVNTEPGPLNFGDNQSSSLRANRRYHYQCGWHFGYNALQISESGYSVRDDTNHNGHWDSDRNGWFAPTTGTQDHDRTGSAHNIHTAEIDAPLATAPVDTASAGCQVIPGIANWTEFIATAWTTLGDPVSYYLVDARDIDPTVWAPCTPAGTHECPYRITSFPYTDSRTTATVATRVFDLYSCGAQDESGPEVVYMFTVDQSGTVTIGTTGCHVTGCDVDVYLLDADDHDSCITRANISFSKAIGPGRYYVVVDTWVNASGTELSGPYTLSVSFN
jgi:hypothetical protein